MAVPKLDNAVRLHSSPGDRPPAPEAVLTTSHSNQTTTQGLVPFTGAGQRSFRWMRCDGRRDWSRLRGGRSTDPVRTNAFGHRFPV